MRTFIRDSRKVVAIAALILAAVVGAGTYWFQHGAFQKLPFAVMPVSVIQLLAVPEDFSGRVIAVKGFLILEEENQTLYLGEDDAANAIFQNGIWVVLPGDEDLAQRYQQLFNRRYVRIIGRFETVNDESLVGIYGRRAPTLVSIQSIEGLPYGVPPIIVPTPLLRPGAGTDQ